MRYRVKDYGVYLNGDTVIVQVNVPITLASPIDDASKRKVIEAIRLIIDETVGEVFCSSMQKSRIYDIYGSNYGWDCGIAFEIPEGKTIASTDQFTIEFDFGEAPEDMKDPNSQLVADFFNITEATEYEAASDSEILNELDDLWTEITGQPVPSSGGSSSN